VVRRAIDEGNVQLLGAFELLPPHPHPGWLTLVTSKHGRTWPVAVAVDIFNHRYNVYILDQIPWSLWEGGNSPLYLGDIPELARVMRERAHNEHE